jgi:hypothetical protein
MREAIRERANDGKDKVPGLAAKNKSMIFAGRADEDICDPVLIEIAGICDRGGR